MRLARGTRLLASAGTTMRKILPLEEAFAVARSLELAGKVEWQLWCKEGLRPQRACCSPGHSGPSYTRIKHK